MSRFRWWSAGIGSAGIVAVVVVVALLVTGDGRRCSDIVRLLDESSTQFTAIQGEITDDAAGEWSTSYSIDQSAECSIIVDVETALYLCEWEYSAASGDGAARYAAEVTRVAACLDPVQGREDSTVSHPDQWISTRFAIAGGDVSVSRKNKNERSAVVVTIGVDASLSTSG